MLYVSLVLLFQNLPIVKRNTFAFISMLAGLESIWCILQFTNVITSADASFKVRGTWVNPNVTAMFLTLTYPYIMLTAFTKEDKNRKYYKMLLVLLVIAILLLKCRTAIFGCLGATALLLEWKYKICRTFYNNSIRTNIVSIIIIAFVIAIISIFGYYVKKDSADGRKLIWGISMKMISKEPFWGFGYGTFERNYNLEQAKYFSSSTGTEKERENASHTQMAYNEIVEHTIEGGVLGGLFFLGFIALLLHTGWKNFKSQHINDVGNLVNAKIITKNSEENKMLSAAHIGIVTLLFMSLVNFTITAIPVMCSFILLTAIATSASPLKKNQLQISAQTNKILAVVFILIGLILLYENSTTAYYQRRITTAINSAINNNKSTAFEILNSIPLRHQQNENYLQALGTLYLKSNQQSEAFKVFQKGTFYYSSPLLYQQIGDYYLETKNFKSAIENYEIAKNIQPNRFTPLYLLLKAHISKRDKINAVKIAELIVAMDEKIPSAKTNEIKKIAKNLLIKLKQPNEKDEN